MGSGLGSWSHCGGCLQSLDGATAPLSRADPHRACFALLAGGRICAGLNWSHQGRGQGEPSVGGRHEESPMPRKPVTGAGVAERNGKCPPQFSQMWSTCYSISGSSEVFCSIQVRQLRAALHLPIHLLSHFYTCWYLTQECFPLPVQTLLVQATLH